MKKIQKLLLKALVKKIYIISIQEKSKIILVRQGILSRKAFMLLKICLMRFELFNFKNALKIFFLLFLIS